MIERIEENEKKLDKLLKVKNKVEKDMIQLEKSLKDYKELQNYYGSREWFQDKEALETDKIPKIKAGVLSEDSVWNLKEDFDEIIEQLIRISKEYYEK